MQTVPSTSGCSFQQTIRPKRRRSVATPIHHCNINSHGKVCHSVFDRNWTTDLSVHFVLSLCLWPPPYTRAGRSIRLCACGAMHHTAYKVRCGDQAELTRTRRGGA